MNEILWKQYATHFGERASPDVAGVEFRSRLLGYDTQEAPRQGDRSLQNITQQFWKEGKEFLLREIERLRAGKSIQSCKILLDVYGIDPYQRLVADIRGMSEEDSPEPKLHRFELAARALETGYAVPTASFYTNQTLLETFHAAIENKRGGFADGESVFVHPMDCRRARYRSELDKSYARRSRYNE